MHPSSSHRERRYCFILIYTFIIPNMFFTLPAALKQILNECILAIKNKKPGAGTFEGCTIFLMLLTDRETFIIICYTDYKPFKSLASKGSFTRMRLPQILICSQKHKLEQIVIKELDWTNYVYEWILQATRYSIFFFLSEFQLHCYRNVVNWFVMTFYRNTWIIPCQVNQNSLFFFKMCTLTLKLQLSITNGTGS